MSSITLVLDDKHTTALEHLADEHNMSKSAILRQALRLYQMVYLKAKLGEKLAFVDAKGQVVRQEVIGLPSFD